VYATWVSLGGNQSEVCERSGEWLARGYGREFLAEMDSHFAHLGPGANHAPVAEHLRREFAAEIEKARRTTTTWCRTPAATMNWRVYAATTAAKRFARKTTVDNLRARTVHYAACFKGARK
jgi:hypothetical protein